MTRSRRQRSVIVFLLTACLLLQQLAMSALACTMPLAAGGSASTARSMAMAMPANMSPDCHGAMAPDQSAPRADPLCAQHCAPDATSASTASIPVLPALALPPVMHALALSQGPAPSGTWSDVAFARSDPPPRLRYCRLLI